jgi:Spy/CpxP family protein refolding chaperone
MKTLKPLTTLAAAALVGLALTTAQAEDKGKPEGKRPDGPRGGGALLENLLPPRLIEELKLSAEQKTKYDELQAAFKKDAAKWREEHPMTEGDREAFRKARETGDKATLEKYAQQRKGLMEKRKGYVDQFKATLTPEQKAQMDEAMEKARERMKGHGGGPGPKGPKGPKPPPAE